MLVSRDVESVFHECFFNEFNTLLVGEAEEPFYRASVNGEPARIEYRYDYISSALHETAHWCVAGTQRRMQDDFGYWYEPDSRSLALQKVFEDVEVLPQSYECFFQWALGREFRVSSDNLALPDYDSTPFQHRVLDKVYTLMSNIPERVQRFALALYDLRFPNTTLTFKQHLQECYENHRR
ncbi:elongation factor P hydroxylase [Marinomonas balearica]|uniref:elongation factor P hydroxylase n=1 Tax=Marinomonas balearica TaxID=491947 RepID=UPI00105F0915|nr:elongation factor P hydroxylase [Marinomonas balearica]